MRMQSEAHSAVVKVLTSLNKVIRILAQEDAIQPHTVNQMSVNEDPLL